MTAGHEVDYTRLLGRLAIAACWVAAIYGFAWVAVNYPAHHQLGYDAHAYWLAGRRAHPYDAAPFARDAFLYSPAFAEALRPLARLPFPAFATVWMGCEALCFAWLLRPVRWVWAVPLYLFALTEVAYGNVFGLYGVMLVASVRWPGVWAFAFLTKIVPGAVGVAWALGRRDRKALGTILGWTAVLSIASVLVHGHLWSEWFRFLQENAGQGNPHVRYGRMLLGVSLGYVAARTSRPWLLAPSLLMAAPIVGSSASFTVLLAIPRLRRLEREQQDVNVPA